MRIVCGVEYDGSPFYGFQRQKQEPTVQQCLEEAISSVANHPVQVVCCGRTDTGVSAALQVIHFDSPAERTTRQWVLGINSALHKAISCNCDKILILIWSCATLSRIVTSDIKHFAIGPLDADQEEQPLDTYAYGPRSVFCQRSLTWLARILKRKA